MTDVATATATRQRRLASAVRRAASSRAAVRAVGVTAALTAAGSLLGLVRDQAVAHLFGAGAESDAFLVAWTVPEVAATVLIEDAMALVMVPAFSAVPAGGGEVRGLVRGTLPRLLVLLGVVTGALAAGAPCLVRLLAPGLADPAAAVACTRLTAAAVLTFGVAGYLSAALRAHHRFVPPAAIYVACNTGIVATMLALHRRFGVRAAAAGVVVGGLLMVAVQLLPAVRLLREPPPTRLPHPARAQDDRSAPASGDPYGPRDPHGPRPAALALLAAPVLLFTLARQSQILLERFFAAPLPPGAISHLNYAQKVAQLPMVASLMVCTVTLPSVSRALAAGERAKARERVERDLVLACAVVLLGAAFVVACAPRIVQLLFQRGRFDAGDTAATAAVMRVYALGLLGQTLVGALVRPYFSARRAAWYPAAAMAAGLAVTAAADAAGVRLWGVYGIAAGNALGITVTAALLLRALCVSTVAVRLRVMAPRLCRFLLAAAAATAAGWALADAVRDPLAATSACVLAVPAVFAATAAGRGVGRRARPARTRAEPAASPRGGPATTCPEGRP